MDDQGEMFGTDTPGVSAPSTDKQETEASLAQVQKVIATIKRDKAHHEKAWKRMKRDMHVARVGYRKEGPWGEEKYTANISGRFVKQKVSGLYAKNPKAQARRRQTLDFTVWDENPDTLKQALGTVQQFDAAAAAAAAPPVPPVPANPPPEATQMHAAADQVGGPAGEHLHAMAHGIAHAASPPPAVPPPMLGHNGGPPMPMQPPPEVQQAQGLVADYQQGMQRRQQLAKFGRTLEILFQHFTDEQKPVNFKVGMKKLVRRACTTGVGYIELGIQRETGPRPGLSEQLADVRARLDHMQNLAKQRAEGDFGDDDAEMAELEASIASLQAEPEIVLREGLIFDFPRSTKVIPDRLCESLVGFEGARHLTIEYLYTSDEVEELFDVRLDGKFIGYDASGRGDDSDEPSPNRVQDEDVGSMPSDKAGKGLVCVWKHYDKPSGLCYFVADGYDGFLRPPAAPDVFVDDFWPVYALTFNDVESEDDLFPPSDVALMLSMQEEFNRAREGQREHRQAARPRAAYLKGQLEDEDAKKIGTAPAFSATPVTPSAPGQKAGDVLDWFKIPGVDPNLYETAMLFNDMQMVVGSSQAGLGATSKATATGDAIAANASASADGSSVDDLDNLLSCVARAAGQIMMREISQEQAIRIAGPGAYWPQQPEVDIADQIYLDVAAASTGKPNQAVEINNWKTMLPFLIQMPDISKSWLAKETIRRLDDDADLTEAIAENVPSIVAQNRTQIQGMTEGPAAAPGPQGGADNGPQPPPNTQGGSAPAFGSNQVHGAGA